MTDVITSSLKHIQDPIDALRRPLRGGVLKGGRTDDRRTRRSKRGDHGLANPAFGETMESRILDGDEERTLVATTYQLAACANIMGKSSITAGGHGWEVDDFQAVRGSPKVTPSAR